jgi:flagellar basal-body rod protein FlgG
VIRGLYASANGLLVESVRMDIISSNLAGAAAPGYRRDIPVAVSASRRLDRSGRGQAFGSPGGPAIILPGSKVDLTPGPMRETGGKLDLALEGPGYFCVQTAAGEAYTRSGAFHLDRQGRLVTLGGEVVLGQAGPIRLTGSEAAVLENGDVVVDGARVDRIKVVEMEAGSDLRKWGGGLLRPEGGSGQAPPVSAVTRVRQGYLEEANVNPVLELAAMISTLRAFEASQRALQANDETLDKVINEVGRV